MFTKDTNPKDAVGTAKVPLSTVPLPVLAELGLAMLEGARKYGRHNYRQSGVRYSVYFDAVNRHMTAWFEGEDVDPDSGLSHITKAIASLFVLRDSMIRGNGIDDRPPKSAAGWMAGLNKLAADIIAKYPDAKDAITEAGQQPTFTVDEPYRTAFAEQAIAPLHVFDETSKSVAGFLSTCARCGLAVDSPADRSPCKPAPLAPMTRPFQDSDAF